MHRGVVLTARVVVLLVTLVCCCDSVADAAHSPKSATFGRTPSRRGGTHPRDYYLSYNAGPFNASCVRPPLASPFLFFPPDNVDVDGSGSGGCFTGDGVQVALLDTGLCAHVAEWSRNDVTCASFVPGVACEDDGCGHGTRSLSVLAGHLLHPLSPPSPRARDRRPEWADGTRPAKQSTSFSPQHYIGMAPRASVRVFRVFDRDGETRERYVTSALDVLLREAEAYRQARLLHSATGEEDEDEAAAESYARPSVRAPVDIVSLSYGGEDYYGNVATQKRIYQLMHDYGVLVVAAAGNDPYHFGGVRSPADMPGVLAVGAVKLTSHGAPAADPPQLFSSRAGKAAGTVEASVAGFAGRGPTTWELPFGAGRVKPELVALGQHVWTVEGVSAPSKNVSSSAPPSSFTSCSRLRLRSISGTSIAAPIVAGVAAVALEAVRWEAESRRLDSPAAFSCDSNSGRSNSYWIHRLQTSLRVRQLLLSTAKPLSPAHQRTNALSTLVGETAAMSSSNTTSGRHRCFSSHAHRSGHTHAAPHTELAGLPLTRLYAGYLQRTKWSVLSQGMGAVQPRRVLQRVRVSAAALHVPETNRCEAFAVPASLRVGSGWMRESEVDARTPSTTVTSEQKESSSLYWWPYSDMAVYPSAAPLLFNFSVYLCPFLTTTCRTGRNSTAAEKRSPPLRHKQHRSDDNGLHGSYEARFELTQVTGHPSRGRPTRYLHGAKDAVVWRVSDGSRGASQPDVVVQRMLEQHLVRSAVELRAVVAPPLPTRSFPLPATSFTLSVALSVPSSAHTRLRYCAHAPNVVEEVKRAPNMRRSGGEDSGERGHANRDDSPANETTSGIGCVPLFHAFSSVTVEGALRIHSRGSRSNRGGGALHSSSSSLLVIPVVIRIRAPPPRTRRVLLDTSLDWFNPTAAASDVFIAGDDPHEATSPLAGSDGDGGPASRRSYAEMGGDHPHTNLALLYVYLRHSLRLAVSFFPLLHVATSPTLCDRSDEGVASSAAYSTAGALNTPSGVTCRAAADAAAVIALSEAGTIILVDPERPLTRAMRHLLRAAVRPDSGKDGLRVVLVTDWFSPEVAAALRWAREGSEDNHRGMEEATGATAGEKRPHNATESPTLSAKHVKSSGDNTLRAWRSNNRSASDTTAVSAAAARSGRGLRGSCHVPSWNRWLDDLASAAPSLLAEFNGTGAQRGGVSDLPQGRFAAPFHMSEDVVVDGVLVVSAGHPNSRDNAMKGSREGGFRSLGQLNGAGVLRWTQSTKAWDERAAAAASASAGRITGAAAGEAVVCGLTPAWSSSTQRLRKRAVATAGASHAAAAAPADDDDEETTTYEDTWENTAREGLDGLEGPHESVVRENGGMWHPTPPHDASLAHGIMGFWTVPPGTQQPQCPTASGPQRSATPGRVAIFTDSNCLSADDHHVQSALHELDQLLSTQQNHSLPTAPIDADALQRLFDSTAGRRFVQKESVQSSACVEVMKELLYWTLTGDPRWWRAEAALRCEARTGPRPTSPGKTSTMIVAPLSQWLEEVGARSHHSRACAEGQRARLTYRDDESSEEDNDDDDDDLLHTAPGRASIGAAVTRLWAATVLAARGDDDGLCNTGNETDLTTQAEVRKADFPSLVLVDTPTTSQMLVELDVAAQDAAEEEGLRALSVRYHGNWDAYVHECENHQTFDSRWHDKEAPRDLFFHKRSTAASMRRTGTPRERHVNDLWVLLYWLRHPVVLAQAVTFVACALGYWVYDRRCSHAQRRRRLTKERKAA
ncbi:subtilisin-like serine peptidase [Leptomonas pyrrhocoris]|uniref:Subtilisin-like serine peptidase n=1 Tax=Leptomonas pyrrhocoris TaxID=157538 RepID=A0A0M9FUW3_LEPPY|nr:subtilisin-like serine peptidase [Leptomonas pyrrhocoris]KPA76439.1 subtilisin-like serine peptidase [Leptomonas pyrrhocoris]|eukprot:XP_015654878.1 subtilisin-like serine peptidase [Leptomonas pyrrhocoris]